MDKAVIQKFFNKECSPAEAREVVEYFKANPDVLDEYLNKSEWEELEISGVMPEEFWNEAWQQIEKKKNHHTRVLWMKRSAVAACIAGVIVLTYFKTAVKKNDLELAAVKENITPAVSNKTVINASDKTEEILLPDSST